MRTIDLSSAMPNAMAINTITLLNALKVEAETAGLTTAGGDPAPANTSALFIAALQPCLVITTTSNEMLTIMYLQGQLGTLEDEYQVAADAAGIASMESKVKKWIADHAARK